MPSKKKKYNARFPAGRIKKIMQTDEDVGKVAQAVPVIISRTIELFVESLITKTMEITTMKNARTLSPYHMKQCILSESRFDFLKDLVKSVPEAATSDTDEGTNNESSTAPSLSKRRDSSDTFKDESRGETSSSRPNFYVEASSKSDSADSDSKSVEMGESNGSCSEDKKKNVFSFYMRSGADDEDYDT